jgi:hypothetical protein
MVALRERRPVHQWLTIVGLKGGRRTIEVSAFPLDGSDGAALGAAAAFWESERE